MILRILKFIKRLSRQINKVELLEYELNWSIRSPKVNLGQIQAYINSQRNDVATIQDVEFRVFSQMGDDGIIQFLINKIDIPHKAFVEFGVESYIESNTRFLLVNNNWSGLVIDGSKENIDYVEKDVISWRHDLYTKHSFITKENINQLISESFLEKGYDKEIGLLSVDIDGNDYWIWKEINVINPVIVIAEYNSVFGSEKAYTIPYKEDFVRKNNSKEYQYYGSSLKAYCILAEEKGYYFIGCNKAGNNAYFIRKDKLSYFKPLTAAEGFVDAAFRECSDENGVKVGGARRMSLIKGLPVVNIETGETEVL
jgi:hypothetical protein